MSGSPPSTTGWIRSGWEYYRRYTVRRTGIHAAATAALTGFGLLAYFEQWFVAVAIAAYLLPPVYLFLTGDDLDDRDRPPDDGSEAEWSAVGTGDDRDGTDADADTDRSDADADGFDADADSDDGDTDSDSDG